MLSKFQSGFRPKHSTITPLIQMCDKWLENMDNGKLNGVIFLDIKKAFDSINHGILLNKMKIRFGISSIELSGSNRTCQIENSNAVSMNNYHPRKQSPVASLRVQSWVHCCSCYILMTCQSV